jgi:16S rRNA (uracil1498-N3)-methyltransferase
MILFDLIILIMQKFLIPLKNINGTKAVIKGQDVKHITKVLRMGLKDEVLFTDGKGKDFISIITKITPEEIELAIQETNNSKFESPVQITIFQGMLKDSKMDTLVRHLTELGVYAWTPVFCERAIPKPDKKRIASRLKRWDKIAIEALKQCNRSILPRIQQPATFTDIIENSSSYDLKITFWENATHRINKINQGNKNIKKIAILIGPEGGFSKAEVTLAESKGFNTYWLGPRILRAETASITACSLIQHYFGDL